MAPEPRGLLLLDRDGVLNRMILRSDGLWDSPMREDEVDVFPWVPRALASLSAAGYGLCIVSNQPAAAKGKASRPTLEAVHARVLAGACGGGAVVLDSYLCWHRAEDGCRCRKPKTGLLEDALREHASFAAHGAWMVGDRPTDVQAGATLGLKTALLDPAPRSAGSPPPDFVGANLEEFARFLLLSPRISS